MLTLILQCYNFEYIKHKFATAVNATEIGKTRHDTLIFIVIIVQVREVKPKSYSDVRKDAQVTIVSATISKKMLTLLAEKVPVHPFIM